MSTEFSVLLTNVNRLKYRVTCWQSGNIESGTALRILYIYIYIYIYIYMYIYIVEIGGREI